MKIFRSLFALCFLVGSNTVLAVPITNLLLSDNSIQVGEQFEVEVWIANDVVGEDLLSFGFDLLPVSPLLSYLGYRLPIEFFDTSFGAHNVSGLAFPGINGSNFLLATLMFQASDVGAANIAIGGLFDNTFYGLFYENSGFDVVAQATFTIEPAAVSVPSPNKWLFSIMALSAWIFRRNHQAEWY